MLRKRRVSALIVFVSMDKYQKWILCESHQQKSQYIYILCVSLSLKRNIIRCYECTSQLEIVRTSPGTLCMYMMYYVYILNNVTWLCTIICNQLLPIPCGAILPTAALKRHQLGIYAKQKVQTATSWENISTRRRELQSSDVR